MPRAARPLRAAALCLAAALGLAAPVAAKVLSTSPRPLPRPDLSAPAPEPAPAPGTTAGAVTLPSAATVAVPVLDTVADPIPEPQAAPVLADPALAGFRPLPRPEALNAAAPMAQAVEIASDPGLAGFRPKPRPAGLGESVVPPAAAPAPQLAASAPPPGGVLGRLFGAPRNRPQPKPAPETRRSAAPETPSIKGSVCGVPGIVGQRIASVTSRVKGCGIAEPVKITAVSGIRLSQPMTLDCATATAFKKWVDRGIVPAVGGKGGGIARFEVGPGYVCRPRNNVRGAKVSEHGRGKAIDLMGLTLKNGQNLDVLNGWRAQPRILQAMHRSACGIFGTVLGPKADRYHQNHIHVDTAKYRSGSYCR